jgi:hypothetical protein
MKTLTQNGKGKIIAQLFQVGLVISGILGFSRVGLSLELKPEVVISRQAENDCRVLLADPALRNETAACETERQGCETSIVNQFDSELKAKLEGCEIEADEMQACAENLFKKGEDDFSHCVEARFPQSCLKGAEPLRILEEVEKHYREELSQACATATPVVSNDSLGSQTGLPSVPDLGNRGNNPLGSPRKVGDGPASQFKQQPIAGFPSQAGKPSSENSFPGGIGIPMDPSMRPDLSTFLKKIPGDLSSLLGSFLPGSSSTSNSGGSLGSVDSKTQTDLSSFQKKLPGDESGKGGDSSQGNDSLSRLISDGGGDGLTKLREKVDSLFSGPQDSKSTSSGSAPGGNTPYGSEGAMMGGGFVDDVQKGAKNYTNTVTNSNEDNTPTGIQKRQAKEEDEFQSATRKTSSDGTVTKDTLPNGTVRVRDENNGTTTTLYPDGSTQTVDNKSGKVIDTTKPSTSMPDPENQQAPLPAVLQKQLQADLAALRAIGPKHEAGNVDFGGEGADAGMPVGVIDRSAPIPDRKGQITDPSPTDGTTTPAHPTNIDGKPSSGPSQNIIHYL